MEKNARPRNVRHFIDVRISLPFLAGDNEAAFSVAPVAFHTRGGESFVVVGTAKGLTFHPRSHEGCFVHVYR